MSARDIQLRQWAFRPRPTRTLPRPWQVRLAERALARLRARSGELAYIETLAGRRLMSVVLTRDVPYKGGSDGD